MMPSPIAETTYSHLHVSGKTRTPDKYRVVYTDHQRLELEKEYQFSKYITIRRKAELAQALSLSERQVGPYIQLTALKAESHFPLHRCRSRSGSRTGAPRSGSR